MMSSKSCDYVANIKIKDDKFAMHLFDLLMNERHKNEVNDNDDAKYENEDLKMRKECFACTIKLRYFEMIFKIITEWLSVHPTSQKRTRTMQ